MFVERIFVLFSASLRRLPLFILLLIALTATSFASAERLRLVTEEWPSLIDNTDAGPESLTGLQVGISPGYSYYGAIRDAKNFERVAMPGIDSGLQMLMLGRIDAMLSNHYVVMAEARRLGMSEDIFVSGVPISSGPVYLAFSLDVPEAFVIEFSKALERYKQANLITELPSSGL